MVDDQGLGDHATHGHADHMRPLDAELGQQCRGIVRHVLYPVGGGGRRLAPEPGRDHGRQVRQSLEFGRQAAVAVVEADHEETVVAQAVHEALGPRRELAAQPHHEQEGGVDRVTLGDELDLDPVDVGRGHSGLPSLAVHLYSYQAGACLGRHPQRYAGSASEPSRCRARRRRGPGSKPTRNTSTEATQTMKIGNAASSKVQWVMVSNRMAMLITAPA